MRRVLALGILLAAGADVPTAAQAQATVPFGVNYQGVLRDASDRPVDGNFDMVFRLYGAASGGAEILVDSHTQSAGGAVGVGGGLFNVVLGSGQIADGSGPGTYTSLASVFRDHGQVYLEVQVAGQVLLPRARIHASPYSFNADNLDGLDSTAFAASAHVHWGTDLIGPVNHALNAEQLQGLDATEFATAAHVHLGSELVGPVSHALTADAFTVDPAACGSGLFVQDVGSDGTLTCGGPAQGGGGQIQFTDGSGALHASSAFTFDEASASLNVTRLETAVDNAVRHSRGFASAASALADLPSGGGMVVLDRDEDDATPLHVTNPAQADGTAGRRDSLVVDARRGGLRFLSSMPEYPSGPTGADEGRVPFVFQVRLNDDRQMFDDQASGEEWNCGRDIAFCSGDNATPCMDDFDCTTAGGTCQSSGEVSTTPWQEWRNCPHGNSSWDIAGGSRQYWHSGQCNVGSSSWFGTSALCGGPHILEVRYPSTPGKMETKPVFAVGNGGVSIYEPENKSIYWRSFLTMFRADSSDKPNHAMYVFDRDGFMADGGAFFGGSPYFPGYAGHTYTQFNAAVHHDIYPENPAFIVFGPRGVGTEVETGAMVRFYDASNDKFGWTHPQYEREAFGFYNQSRLYLGSYQDSNPDLTQSQYLEWEGRVKDGATTRLGLAVEPTAANFIALPNASGTVALEQNVVTLTGEQTVTGTKHFAGNVAIDGSLRFGAGRGRETCLARDPKGNGLFVDTDCDGALDTGEALLDRPRGEPERDLACNTILALRADVTALSEPGAEGAYSFVTADGSVPLLMPRAGVFHDLQVEIAGLEAPCAYEARLLVNDVETALGCEAGANGLADCEEHVERVTSASRDKVRLRVTLGANQGACGDRAEAIIVSLCWSSSRPSE